MTNEERDIITRFIERISGAQGATGFTQGQAAQPLPPVDPEADRLIGELFTKYPEARYRLTQTAFVQEQALAQATAAIQRLQQELAQARQAGAAQQHSGGGGFLSGLFGGGRQSAPPPQQAPVQQAPAWNQGAAPQPQYGAPPPQYPQYASGYQPGMLGSGGSGFLGSALRTAAGVAGGVVLGNALMNMFEGHHGSGATLLPDAGESPWGSPPAAGTGAEGGYVDQGSWTPDAGRGAGGGWTDAAAQPDQGGGLSDAQPPSDSWSDAGGGDGGGWSDAGGGGWDDSSNA